MSTENREMPVFCLHMVGAYFNRLCDFVSYPEERLGADRISGAQLRCTCKMALSMAPKAFISTIDNALFAQRRCRPDLPSASRMSGFRAGPASGNTQLPSYRGASNPDERQLQKKAEPDGFRLFCKVPTGFEPVNNGFADRPLRPLGYSTIALECPITLPKRHIRCKYYSHLSIRTI